ncbi:DUF4349 domain-containing protein [Dactylosporangium vinaceum]|uniref:DUF4349 domain-containing protein n=1 Tax=Dactylosporangium vinaceum TaxID=53362 RepID=A0ABV5MI35_9ACTN|nr:DUF4349 domain-containing protein [Dactylosporangium vinaceum]UAB97486.1 DUF4349 domain-containing protein [Dactylosporangium vinaceum]
MSVRRTTAYLAAAATAVLLVLSGCGADSSDSPSASSNRAAPEAAAPANGGAGPALAPGDGAKDQSGTEQKIPDNLDAANRAIIYSGTMTITVKDVNAAAAQAVAFATGAGGFVGGDNRQINGERSTATLILRVPAAKFQATLDQLKGIGDEESRQLSAQDVTDQVVDVESRITTAQASVDRIRALLAKAQTIGEITSLESELSRRESDLESLQARKRKLDGLTALSTITLMLHGPDAPAVSKEDTGILVGLRNGWDAFVASLRVALTILGWLLPWLVFLGLPIALLIWLNRRRRARLQAPTQAVAPVPAPALVPAQPSPQAGPAPQARPAPQAGPAPARPAAAQPAATKAEDGEGRSSAS